MKNRSLVLGSVLLAALNFGVIADSIAAKTAPYPKNATAVCRDGWISYSAHRSGTCSHHGGVKKWIHRPKY